MKVSTTRFGVLEIEADKVITLPEGMIGFDERKFILLNPEKGGPFCWFQSIENPALAFVVVDPQQFVPDYKVKLTRDEYDKLQLAANGEIILLSVVTMSPDPRLITANLQGPIVINPVRMTAMQLVMDGNHDTWHQLFAPRNTAATASVRPMQPIPALYNVASLCSGMNLSQACP